ncbi:MAG: GDYXXLXY domain-containing protein [Gammaproteobacteria bacterium]|jgi:hypothetical protein
MNSRVIFLLFVLVAVIQLAVPISQIARHEHILQSGEPYKFRTAPVDPADAFRGRYVALAYEGTAAPLREGDDLRYGMPAYVRLGKDEAGFARFIELSATPPESSDYLLVESLFAAQRGDGGKMHFSLPFDRLYMDEADAPRAEAVYRRHAGRSDGDAVTAYVLVRVKEGRGVIEELYIDGRPIGDILSEDTAKQ